MAGSHTPFNDLTSLTATQLARAIRMRSISAADAVEAHLARIARINPLLNAVVHVDAERAMGQAAHIDRGNVRDSALLGVPILLKDSHRVAGMPTVVGNPEASTSGSGRDGFIASRLRAAGAIILGKTNVPRDLADFQTHNPVHGTTNNPWDLTRTPGGSSGGAAAAVAARLTSVEVGSDIAGSIRVPAAFTGVIGFKPSAGLISTNGHVVEPVRHPRGGGVGVLAVVGPLARDLDDIELMLGLLSARPWRPAAPTSNPRIGLLPSFPHLRVDAEIQDAVVSLGRVAIGYGADVRAVVPPSDMDRQHDAWVTMYRAAARMGRSWTTRQRLARERARVLRSWEAILRGIDVVVCPAVMCLPFVHRRTGEAIDVDGVETPYWGLARYAEPFSLTGLPAITIPVRLSSSGLPIGVQVIARPGADRKLISIARLLLQWAEPLPVPRI